MLYGNNLLWKTEIAADPSVFDGLVGYYKLDETTGATAFDSVGSIDGTLTEGVFDPNGKIDYCYYNATSDTQRGIQFGDNFTIDITTPRTMSAWVKQTNDTNFMIFSKQDATADQRGFYIGINTDGHVFLNLRNSATNYMTTQTVSQDFDTPFNIWRHLVVTYDGSGNASGWKIYINGVDEPMNITNDGLTLTTVTTEPFTLGAFSRASGWSIQGYLDEFGIWDEVLSQSEVDELYNGGVGLTYTP